MSREQIDQSEFVFCAYFGSLRGVIDGKIFVRSNFNPKWPRSHENSDFQGNIFWSSGGNNIILPLEMKSRDPEEHSTAFKVECAELLAEKFCFVYKNMLLRRQRASERREMSWLDIQATSFSEYFKQFPELY
ncbi:MAG: hypothetical protein OIF58_15495, partial [Cohaesibacter sp.]|nr:hypothetical protein [Cohaesibacter sp.]